MLSLVLRTVRSFSFYERIMPILMVKHQRISGPGLCVQSRFSLPMGLVEIADSAGAALS